MKVEKYRAEFVHEKDSTIIVDEWTLKKERDQKYFPNLYKKMTYKRKDKDRERNNAV